MDQKWFKILEFRYKSHFKISPPWTKNALKQIEKKGANSALFSSMQISILPQRTSFRKLLQFL